MNSYAVGRSAYRPPSRTKSKMGRRCGQFFRVTMQLLSLRIENFGLFRGAHYFDLASPSSGEGTPNLTVFVGHNGAGKSTLFQAIRVALHGVLAVGDKITAPQYNNFLYGHMHRHKEGAKTTVSTEASVALSFGFVQSGIPRRVHVARRWQRNGRAVSETLEVLQDSQVLATEAADAQAWINDLLPPGVARLCFFDAEDLDALAGADQRNPSLGEALQRLLGLDLIQRAQADLRAYLIKQGGSNAVSNLRHVVLAHQTSLEALDRKLDALKARMEEVADEETNTKSQVAEQERLLAAAGGLYAARRTVQQERLAVMDGEITAAQTQIADQAAHLLPFALAPQLCRRLAARVMEEDTAQREQVAQTLLSERLTKIETQVSGERFWEEVALPPKKQQDIIQRLLDVIEKQKPAASTSAPLLHHLAAPERVQLHSWIDQTLEVVPGQVHSLGDCLRGLQEERRTLELDLQRAPDDEALAPLHAALVGYQTALADVQRRRAQLTEETGAASYQRTEKDRLMEKAILTLTTAQAGEAEMVLAERSRTVLRAYEIKLTQQRLSALEKALVRCFNALCQKEYLLAAVTIQPDDFAVELESADGRVLQLGSFSAGERQLYALALLQAMREVSDRQLPLLVDTPLARLDAEHRHRLLHDYLPAVSDQILLFATDAEADAPFLTEAQPYLAHTYRLQFDPLRGDTQATQVEANSPQPSESLSLQELNHGF